MLNVREWGRFLGMDASESRGTLEKMIFDFSNVPRDSLTVKKRCGRGRFLGMDASESLSWAISGPKSHSPDMVSSGECVVMPFRGLLGTCWGDLGEVKQDALRTSWS